MNECSILPIRGSSSSSGLSNQNTHKKKKAIFRKEAKNSWFPIFFLFPSFSLQPNKGTWFLDELRQKQKNWCQENRIMTSDHSFLHFLPSFLIPLQKIFQTKIISGCFEKKVGVLLDSKNILRRCFLSSTSIRKKPNFLPKMNGLKVFPPSLSLSLFQHANGMKK